MRRTLLQARMSDLPQRIGLCRGDLPSIAAAVNHATERLLYIGGDSGWWGCWDKVLFTVTQAAPYITLHSKYSRVINLAICNAGIRVQNEFYEVMEAGIGVQPPAGCQDWCGAVEGFERGVFSSMADLPTTDPQYLRVYVTDPADIGKTILFQGAKDANGVGIYETSVTGPMNGVALSLTQPFVTSSMVISSWDSIFKDVTTGDLVLKAVNANTGEETTLSRYLPWETNPAYRRYFINKLPRTCCGSNGTPNLPVTAMCKLEFMPIANDTDQLLISNLPALIEECDSIRHGAMEDPGAAEREARHHTKAIKLLQSEMRHYLGSKWPAVSFSPFGTATLERQMIGRLM